MKNYHSDGELAPRDDVARAIFAEIEAGRTPMLDCRKAVGDHFPDHFPTVFEACMSGGIDPRKDPIPVAPAVHYHMGGVATDSYGQSSLEGLMAVGECSATGLHGANRLASNSLLEAIVFGGRAAEMLLESDFPERKADKIRSQPWLAMTEDVSKKLRTGMTKSCGVRRKAKGLNKLIETIDELIEQVGRANPLIAARLIAASALAREESRGGHFRDDFPDMVKPGSSSYISYDMLD